MRKLFEKLARRDEGISALEYALIAGLVALAIIFGATQLGTNMNSSFNTSATQVKTASE
ncbi:MAG: Flp family type IVb pilin [Deltaproteobacteria bacterium]|nr:Flp family type IVb pilin [Deltaproteobacteria bacterium]